MKPREFWIRQDKENYVDFFTASDKKFLAENLSDECFDKELIHVREVSPDREAAIAGMVRALEYYNYGQESVDIAQVVSSEPAREALEKFRKATE